MSDSKETNAGEWQDGSWGLVAAYGGQQKMTIKRRREAPKREKGSPKGRKTAKNINHISPTNRNGETGVRRKKQG